MNIFESLKSKISGKNLKIVFPEGEELRSSSEIERRKNHNSCNFR